MRTRESSTFRATRRGADRRSATWSSTDDEMEREEEDFQEEDDEQLYPTRSRSSARRYRTIEQEDSEDESAADALQAVSPLRARRHMVSPASDGQGEDQVNIYVRRRSRSAVQASPRALPPPARARSRDTRDAPYATESVRLRGTSAPTPRRPHGLLWLGLGMLVMFGLWVGGTMLVSWWHLHQDDVTYGRPRTFQSDAVVGHSDSPAHPSHFIALNLNRQVEIIEFPGSDGSHARIYLGPTLLGDGEDLTPVTLSFRDVTGDGKPDMLISIVGQNTAVVFVNDNGVFRPQRPGDVIHL